MEYKATPMLALDVDESADEATVESIVAVFGNTDEGGDVIKAGAFKKTLRERLPRGEIKVFWQHDRLAPPVGVVVEMVEWGKDQLPAELTTRFPDATGALYAKWQGLPTERGREVVAGIKAGALTENSIGWDAIKFTIEKPQSTDDPAVLMLGKRIVSEARLWEFSPVNWGMNRATMNLKARADLWAEDYHLVQLADLLPALTALDLKAGRVLSATNLDKLKAALQTLSQILLTAEPPSDDDAKALTVRADALRRRLAIVERELIAASW